MASRSSAKEENPKSYTARWESEASSQKKRVVEKFLLWWGQAPFVNSEEDLKFSIIWTRDRKMVILELKKKIVLDALKTSCRTEITAEDEACVLPSEQYHTRYFPYPEYEKTQSLGVDFFLKLCKPHDN